MYYNKKGLKFNFLVVFWIENFHWIYVWNFFSGLWLSVFSLGNFVGPTISGVVVQVKGFRFTTMIFFVLYLLMLLFDIIEAIKRKIQENGRRDELWYCKRLTWKNIEIEIKAYPKYFHISMFFVIELFLIIPFYGYIMYYMHQK